MKKSYLILALALTSTAVVLVIHQNRFFSRDTAPSQLTRDDWSQESSTLSDRENSMAVAQTHRKISSNLSSFTIESVDPSQAEEVKELLPFAKKRLELLDGELALNATQQKRIFELLVAYAASDDLALQIGGRAIQAPAMSMEDAILQELDPDRARIYQQSLIDHASWWNHAIEEMEQSIAEESDSQNIDPIEIP